MTTKRSKEDQKWILFNQKMGRMSGKRKLTIENLWETLQEAHDEAYNEDHQ